MIKYNYKYIRDVPANDGIKCSGCRYSRSPHTWQIDIKMFIFPNYKAYCEECIAKLEESNIEFALGIRSEQSLGFKCNSYDIPASARYGV